MNRVRTCFVSQKSSAVAFSRVDLLFVTFAITLLATTLFPALASIHVNTQNGQCLYNLRQLTAGWWMYANDNEGKLAPNRGLFPANSDDYVDSNEPYPVWVAGNMRQGSIGGPYTGVDATNSALLVDPRYSQLAVYVKTPSLYHCPADQSTWSTVNSPASNEVPRVRSYSMNGAFGPLENGQITDGSHVLGHWLSSQNANAPGGVPWRVYTKVSDLVAPMPSQLFLMLDEHPDSINDAYFAVQMPAAPAQTFWVDVPAAYHQNGCDFSFADGHVEYHQWQEPQYLPPNIWAADTVTGKGNEVYSFPRDSDVIWLTHRTTAPAPGVVGIYQP